jgi:hypothetical protein
MGRYCRKQREFTPEEQQAFDAVWANPAYSKRAKLAFKDAVERFAMHNGPIEVFDPFDVFERDHWRCKRCNKYTPRELRDMPRYVRQTDKATPTLDHIVPIGKGGCHVVSNCQLLCYECNDVKQNRHDGELPPPIRSGTNLGELLLAALRK